MFPDRANKIQTFVEVSMFFSPPSHVKCAEVGNDIMTFITCKLPLTRHHKHSITACLTFFFYFLPRQDWSGLPEGVKAEGDRLHFLKLSPELDGVYICEAVNKNGAAAGSVFRQQKEIHLEL